MSKVRKPIYDIPVYFFETLGKTLNGETLQGTSLGSLLEESYFGKVGVKLKLRLSPAFWKNYAKLSPEERKKWNPFKFREGKIERILSCEKRYLSKGGKYICGPPTTDDQPDEDSPNGYFGGCYIHGYDNDDLSFCPYNKESKYNKTKGINEQIKDLKSKIKELKLKKKKLN